MPTMLLRLVMLCLLAFVSACAGSENTASSTNTSAATAESTSAVSFGAQAVEATPLGGYQGCDLITVNEAEAIVNAVLGAGSGSAYSDGEISVVSCFYGAAGSVQITYEATLTASPEAAAEVFAGLRGGWEQSLEADPTLTISDVEGFDAPAFSVLIPSPQPSTQLTFQSGSAVMWIMVSGVPETEQFGFAQALAQVALQRVG